MMRNIKYLPQNIYGIKREEIEAAIAKIANGGVALPPPDPDAPLIIATYHPFQEIEWPEPPDDWVRVKDSE